MEEEIKTLIYRSIYWIVGLFIVIFGISILAREPIINFSRKFVDLFGFYGIGFGIALSDASPGLIIPDAFLVFGIAGQIPDYLVILASSVGTLVGGSLSYLQGRYLLPKLTFAKDFIERHEEKLIPILEKYGVWAVVLASSTPLPYSWMAILAGSFKMPFYRFLMASLARIPRFVLYFYAIKLGWVHGI